MLLGLRGAAGPDLGDRAVQPVMTFRMPPPVAICHSRKMPAPAKSRLADHTEKNAESLFWRPSAMPVEERK